MAVIVFFALLLVASMAHHGVQWLAARALRVPTERFFFHAATPAVAVWRRALALLAGPVGSLLLAILLTFVLALAGAEAVRRRVVVIHVDEGSAADGRLMEGDELVALDGTPAVDVSGAIHVATLVQHAAGAPQQLHIVRRGAPRAVTVTARQHDTGWRLGIRLELAVTAVGLGAGVAARHAVRMPVESVRQAISWLHRGAATPGGPVYITSSIKVRLSAQERWFALLRAFAMVNVMVGLVHLLPLPMFDGGRLLRLAWRPDSR